MSGAGVARKSRRREILSFAHVGLILKFPRLTVYYCLSLESVVL